MLLYSSLKLFLLQQYVTPAVHNSYMNMISTYAYFSGAYPIDRDINVMSVADVIAIPFGAWNLDFFSAGVQALLPSSKLVNNSNIVS